MTKAMAVRLLALWCGWQAAAASAGYGDLPAARALVDELVEERGLDRDHLLQVMASAERQERILEAMSRPAERVKPWYEYRQIFLNEQRVTEGLAFYRTHEATFRRVQAELGVPPEIVLAILGVETSYGRITGSYRVLDALATLAFDYPRRSSYFSKELKNYLILTAEQQLDPLAMQGSYAGAMGYGQFMPSSYRSYAIDFDADGRIDIWNNPVDGIGSVANYLRRHGWRSGEGVVVPAAASAEVPEAWFGLGLVPKRRVDELKVGGLRARAPLEDETLVTPVRLELEEGYEYWLGLHNFYVITRYNHSAMYAMSVYQLSQRLAAGLVQ
ncbi:MAG: lytic murein transglycosylase B [Haliea sp.]|jgi:membrane-bound lytic murein transglycosylase B|uniref:lytic murein transglycosylase B n=1 Tax=Haliea sp. TaxID=1932666 RepID=UPI000C39D9DD|nr:lytic murein transglycosylase B [Haliea sp.]MBM69515.1 lytic murein transglycosylase B [Haliea sp.]|tara:strand:+ start:19156 stop:20142 length:987 start_codon:yes stop_codon:yes gene_type:complete